MILGSTPRPATKLKKMAKRKKPVGAPIKPESEKVVPILFYTKRKNVNEVGGVENARFKAKQLFENHINNK